MRVGGLWTLKIGLVSDPGERLSKFMALFGRGRMFDTAFFLFLRGTSARAANTGPCTSTWCAARGTSPARGWCPGSSTRPMFWGAKSRFWVVFQKIRGCRFLFFFFYFFLFSKRLGGEKRASQNRGFLLGMVMWVFLKGTTGEATYVEVPNFENTQDLMWRKVAVPQKPKEFQHGLPDR